MAMRKSKSLHNVFDKVCHFGSCMRVEFVLQVPLLSDETLDRLTLFTSELTDRIHPMPTPIKYQSISVWCEDFKLPQYFLQKENWLSFVVNGNYQRTLYQILARIVFGLPHRKGPCKIT